MRELRMMKLVKKEDDVTGLGKRDESDTEKQG